MADAFESWFDRTIEHEGGFVNDPDDKGGATNYGITQDTYSEFKGRKVTVDEIENMTLEEAKDFYLDFFGKLGVGNVPDSLARGYSDAAVNLGRGGASKVVQMACNTKLYSSNYEEWIDVDGAVGSGTREAISNANLNFWDWYAELSMWYANLILKGCGFSNERTTQHRFQRGWFRRLLTNFFDDRIDEMSIEELEEIIEKKKAEED